MSSVETMRSDPEYDLVQDDDMSNDFQRMLEAEMPPLLPEDVAPPAVIRSLTMLSAHQRLTAELCCAHPWLVGC